SSISSSGDGSCEAESDARPLDPRRVDEPAVLVEDGDLAPGPRPFRRADDGGGTADLLGGRREDVVHDRDLPRVHDRAPEEAGGPTACAARAEPGEAGR